MVSLSITVTDGGDRVITDLAVDDYTVYDDRVVKEVEFFSREDLPLRMAIVLVTSASMLQRTPVARRVRPVLRRKKN